ncbi:uncharacterized protein LOC124461137 [Drosophila willistoni]|uniref:uncharacterized protein LOC111519110 n=1 Tax=Drosophila willistoni TaxID=7260 RepID=UPI001F07725C|nr:uncharacterized protein LOC111519110 [Drosophila willistoni]XP_046868651.1 uncharacterized protein LOC124461137 [Drosophila willistoni]
MLVKLSTLQVAELDIILQTNNIHVNGNKQAKIDEITTILGTDQINTDEYDFNQQNSTMQRQMDELKQMVADLSQAVSTINVRTQNLMTERQERANEPARSEENHQHDVVEQQSMGQRISPRDYKSNTSIKDVIGMLPEFDPIKGAVNSQQFLDKVEQLQIVYEWRDATILFAVQQKLRGVAKDWLDSQRLYQTWSQFKDALLKDFPSVVNISDVYRQMMRRKRKHNETLIEYFYSMMAIGRKGNIDDKSINSYIINGLNQQESTKALLAMNLCTCAELFRSLENMNSSSVWQSYRTAEYASSDTAKTMEVNKDNNAKGPKCFNCNNIGHIAAKCPVESKKPRCSFCSKIGHEGKDCRLKRSTVSKVDSIKDKKRPPILKKILIEGHEYEAFVDTGSDNTFMQKSQVPIDAVLQVMTNSFRGFGGGIVESKECLLTEIVWDNKRIDVCIYVVQDKELNYAVLLGRDILCAEDETKVETKSTNSPTEVKCEFDIGAEVDDPQRKQVSDLLNAYTECFAEDFSNIGRCKSTKMEIKVTTTNPIVGRRYQVPFAKRDALRTVVDELLKYNIIQRSTSPHAASSILVPKPNGEHRLCVDFKTLNAVTVKQHYPMPVVEEQLAKLAGNHFFTTLDMTSGYYQIEMSNESNESNVWILSNRNEQRLNPRD